MSRQIEILDISTGALITGRLYIGKPLEDRKTRQFVPGSIIEFEGGGGVCLTANEHAQLCNTAFFNGDVRSDGEDAWDEYLAAESSVLAQLALELEALAQVLDEVGLLF